MQSLDRTVETSIIAAPCMVSPTPDMTPEGPCKADIKSQRSRQDNRVEIPGTVTVREGECRSVEEARSEHTHLWLTKSASEDGGSHEDRLLHIVSVGRDGRVNDDGVLSLAQTTYHAGGLLHHMAMSIVISDEFMIIFSVDETDNELWLKARWS
jgi:hypothetical protein